MLMRADAAEEKAREAAAAAALLNSAQMGTTAGYGFGNLGHASGLQGTILCYQLG